jgi:hypothetical protein
MTKIERQFSVVSNEEIMEELSLNEVDEVSGGLSIRDLAFLAKVAYKTVKGGLDGAQNVMQFTGQDMFLDALNGGNLGA